MLKQILINSVDVSPYVVGFEKESAYGDVISQIEINVVKTISSTLTLSTGQTIEVWRGFASATEEKIFSGYIENYTPDGGIVKITGKDKMWDLVRKEITHTYDKTIDASAGKVSEIFKDIVTTYGGLTADATTIQDSGSAIIIDKFVCNHTDLMERCKKLAESLDWQFYYRADTDKVYFEPKGFSFNSNVYSVGGNIIGIPQWKYDNTEMINDVTIVGAYQEIETTESGQIGVTSNYTTSSVLLNFTPISVKVYLDASNPPTTLKVGGLPDSTSTYNYYVDKANKKILPAVGTTFTTNYYMETRYSHAIPIPVHMYNQESIDLYGQFKKTITYTDIRSVEDSIARGTNVLARYAVPFVYTTLKIKVASTNSLSVGQMVRVVDGISNPNVNRDLVVTRHRIRYPADYEELDVGDKFWRMTAWQSSVEERLKRLFEEEIQNQDIVTELLDVDNRIQYPINIQNRYVQILLQNMAGDTIIWGNSSFGTWDSFKWGDSGSTSAETDFYIAQYNNIYEETFYDTDFKDASTTSNWDTANKQLVM